MSRRRGFALVTALGVLALLIIIAFGAAGSAQFSFNLSQARQRDRQFGEMLREAAQAVHRTGLAPVASAATELTSITLNANNTTYTIRATVSLAEQSSGTLGTALQSREGDAVVELMVTDTSERALRGAIYLMNVAGKRSKPILLLERRP